MEIYASTSEQPKLRRDPSELNPVELEVHNFFSNEENINKLITYLSLEEKKGKDKFNGFRFLMFKVCNIFYFIIFFFMILNMINFVI